MASFSSSIKNLFSITWQDCINILHSFDRIRPTKNYPDSVGRELKKRGIVSVNNFLSPEQCDALANKLRSFADAHKTSTKFENGTTLNYRNEKNPQGHDHGMIDIFNVDMQFPEIGNIDVSEIKEMIIGVHHQKVVQARIHAYVNRGVANTRSYHIDNAQPVVYKGFLYLTDVKDIDDGPYSFVKGSQRLCRSVYWNIMRNMFYKKYLTTDMPKYRQSKVVDGIAPKGTFILSNQNGIHRGQRQKPDRERIAIIFTFIVVSKLNYLHASAKKALQEAEKIRA